MTRTTIEVKELSKTKRCLPGNIAVVTTSCNMQRAKELRILLVGDNKVGKRDILVAFAKGGRKYSTPVLGVERCKNEIEIDGRMFKVEMSDTQGKESSAKLNSGSYKDVDAVALIYDDAKSFKSLIRWLDDVNLNCGPDVVRMVLYHKRKSASNVSHQEAEKFVTDSGLSFFKEVQGNRTSVNEVIQKLISVLPLPNSFSSQTVNGSCQRDSPPPRQNSKPYRNRKQVSCDDKDILNIIHDCVKEFCEKYLQELTCHKMSNNAGEMKPTAEHEIMVNLHQKLKNVNQQTKVKFLDIFKHIVAEFKQMTNKLQEMQDLPCNMGGTACKQFARCLEYFFSEMLKSCEQRNRVPHAQAKAVQLLDANLLNFDIEQANEIRSCFETTLSHLQDIMPQLFQPAPNTSITRYKPEQFMWDKKNNLIGKGGFASVRLAFHDSLGWVAIKQLEYGDLLNGKPLEKCLKESYIAHLAAHRNVVQVFGVTALSDRSLGLVMEYMPGGSLAQLIVHERFKQLHLLRLKLRIFSDIASGIAYLHNIFEERRISHNDIKPQNVLMNYELTCKISDFGGADLAMRTDLVPAAAPQKTTEFTPLFASPERLSSFERLTKASDVYSFGLTGYCVVEGAFPHDKKTFLDKIMRGQRPAFSDHISNVPEDSRKIHLSLQDIVKQCWRQLPSDRPSMLLVRDKLYQQLSSIDVVTCMKEVVEAAELLDLRRPQFRRESFHPLSHQN